MKRVVVLLAAATCLWPATNPGATAEASKGLALALEGKYKLAIEHYRAVIAADRHLPGIYLNLGLAYFKLNRFPDAASAFEEAVKADPASFQSRVLLGMSYYGCRRFDAPAVHLNGAAEEEPAETEMRHHVHQH